MSYYTEKNALAKFWNRDHTRLEWAKWVFHHPEQTEALVEKLLGMPDSDEINSILNRLNIIEQVNADQATQITQLLATVQQSTTVDSIAMEQLIEWLAQNPDPDDFIHDVIEAIPMEQLVEWLATNPIPDGISETQFQALLNFISQNKIRDDLQQQQINDLLNTGSIAQEQLEELLEQTIDDNDISNATAITKEQLDELLNQKGEDD